MLGVETCTWQDPCRAQTTETSACAPHAKQEISCYSCHTAHGNFTLQGPVTGEYWEEWDEDNENHLDTVR